jgi:hypothetical protein
MAIGAGKHVAADGSTITVKASAGHGVRLVGQTKWTHTFGAAAQCSGTGGQSSGGGGPTAVTGAPVGELLLAGLGLVLAGGAVAFGARSRRSGGQPL